MGEPFSRAIVLSAASPLSQARVETRAANARASLFFAWAATSPTAGLGSAHALTQSSSCGTDEAFAAGNEEFVKENWKAALDHFARAAEIGAAQACRAVRGRGHVSARKCLPGVA